MCCRELDPGGRSAGRPSRPAPTPRPAPPIWRASRSASTPSSRARTARGARARRAGGACSRTRSRAIRRTSSHATPLQGRRGHGGRRRARPRRSFASVKVQLIDVGVTRADVRARQSRASSGSCRGSRCRRARLVGTPPAIPAGRSFGAAFLSASYPDVAGCRAPRGCAANAQIGIAVSAYYPSFTLESASSGVESTALGTLFEVPSTLWSVGAWPSRPSSTAAVATRARMEQALRGMPRRPGRELRQSVLEAFREVEDSLAALSILRADGGRPGRRCRCRLLRLVVAQRDCATGRRRHLPRGPDRAR